MFKKKKIITEQENGIVDEFLQKKHKDEKANEELSDLAESEIKKAKKSLKQRGVEVTPETIVAQVYIQGGSDSLSREELRQRADEYVHANQKKLAVMGLFALTVVNFVILAGRYVYCIYSLDRIIFCNSPVYILVSVLLPIITWVLMTSQEYFNYYKRKMNMLVLVVANAIATVLQVLYTMIWDWLVVLIFKIKVTDAMTQNMIINLARMAEVGSLAVGVFVLAKAVYPFLFTEEARRKIEAFKLKHIWDMRDDKEYKYDFVACRDLKTGAKIVIKQVDRFVHFLILGASGTGKTSSIYTPQICADIDTRSKNLEMQQKAVLKMVQNGDVVVERPFKAFNKQYFRCVNPKKMTDFNEIFKKYQLCGITVIAPNNSMNEDILTYASARGIWVNNIDPTKKAPTHPYERLVGMNPFYVPPEFSMIEKTDREKEEERTIYIAENANNFADALTAINEMAGTGDVYFTDVNTTVTSNVATVAMLDASIQGKQINIGDIYNLINDFNLLLPIVKRIENFFDMTLPDYKKEKKGHEKKSVFHTTMDDITDFRDENMKTSEDIQKIYNELSDEDRKNPYSKTLITVKARLQKDSKMDEHAEGLRNLLGKLLQDPRVARVLMTNDNILDFNEILADNAITVVNTALQLGRNTSTCFGQLFLLSFNSAVLKRPKNATPHFLFEDETARYLAETIDTMVTLYRQYNVACAFALQSLSQPRKSKQTEYLRDTMLSVGTLIAFGRTSVEDSKTVSDLGGQEKYEMVQKTYQHSSVFAENPSTSFSERTTPDQQKYVEEQDVRFRDFQEFTIITSDEGRVLPARLGKASFVPEEAFADKPSVIRRNELWRMVWTSKFPKKEDVMPVNPNTVIASEEQEKIRKSVDKAATKQMVKTADVRYGAPLSGSVLKSKRELETQLSVGGAVTEKNDRLNPKLQEIISAQEDDYSFDDNTVDENAAGQQPGSDSGSFPARKPVQKGPEMVADKQSHNAKSAEAEPEPDPDVDSIEKEYELFLKNAKERAGI